MPSESESWTAIGLGAIPNKAHVGEMDIDGRTVPVAATPKKRGAAERTKRFLVTLGFSSDALREIDAFFRRSGRIIVALTVREILEEHIARKLAE